MKYLIFITFFIISLGAYMFYNKKINTKLDATFGVPQLPFSSDPMDYDFYVHHWAFSSVFAKLVSSEKNGEIHPMIASEWKNENNFQKWTFKIRSDLSYSNGESIKIDDILLNFKRIAFLKKKNNSNSGLLEFLVGFNKIEFLSNDIEGLSIDKDSIIFQFIKPMPNLLDVISFGFYGITHPSQFDPKSGEWLNKKTAISTGPYQIKIWSDDQFEIQLRDNVEYSKKNKNLINIKFKVFSNAKSSSDLDDIDFMVADKNSLLVDHRFNFIGSNVNFKIGYVQCHSWDKENSPFANKATREWFRMKFYEGLLKNNFEITNSFFPPTLQGLKKIDRSYIVNKPEFKHFTLKTHPMSMSYKIKENSHKKSISEIFATALLNLGIDSGATLLQLDLESDSMYDVAISGSGIEASDYIDTVKFMFLSKEGIRLPDINGKIKEELKKESPDINFINQEIWDQAVIWPIRHYSSGYWFNKNSNIDYSDMNFESPSIDFQFLKWK